MIDCAAYLSLVREFEALLGRPENAIYLDGDNIDHVELSMAVITHVHLREVPHDHIQRILWVYTELSVRLNNASTQSLNVLRDYLNGHNYPTTIEHSSVETNVVVSSPRYTIVIIVD